MSEITNGWYVDLELAGRITYSVRLVPFDGTPEEVINEAIAAAKAEIGDVEVTGASAHRIAVVSIGGDEA